MAPFAAQVYLKRQGKAYSRMQSRGIQALFLPPSGDLEYLTGFRRRKVANTDIVQPADWLYGVLLVPYAGIYVLAPYMAANYVRHHVADKPWLQNVIYLPEHESPTSFLAGLPRRFGMSSLAGIKVAVGNRTWAETVYGFTSALPGLQIVPVGDLVSALRMVKDPDELELMRRAAAIADAAFTAIVAKLKPGITDLDVATEVDYQLALAGGEYTSFPTGITFAGRADARDEHASREVGPPARLKLEPGMHIAFDFGAVYQGYCSDFGRTVYCGDPEPELVKYHELVMAAQAAGMAAMRADGKATGADADRAARSVIAAAGHGNLFWHRLGHGIGLDVHEPPFLTASEARPLEAGMTFTVEPSVLGRGLAVRVEDVVLVTPEGGESLNQATREILVV